MDKNYDLTKMAGRGIIWNLVGQAIQQLIQAFVIIILARLLAPEDFGIFAMVIVFFNFSEPFRQWGFQAFLIRKENADSEYEDTAFWSICVIAIFLFVLSIIFAPLIARFFNSPQLAKFLMIGSFGFLLSPIGAVQWAQANKKMDFKAIMIRGTLSIFIYGVCASFLAFRGFGVWSLVIAFIVKEFSFSVIFWMIYDWRPHLRFSYSKFKEMMGFSMNCIGSGVFSFFTNNVDNILVGKFLGTVNLGLYNLAFNTVTLPENKFVAQIMAVAFPVFSKIQQEKERIRELYIKAFRLLMVILIPILSILFICTRDFVVVFYGEKWLLAVIPIKIMCLYGLIRGLVSLAEPVFLSLGRSDIQMKISLFRLIIFISFIFPGLRFGIVGVSVALLLYSLIIFCPIFYFCNKFLGVNNLKFYLMILRYLLLFFVTSLTILFFNELMNIMRLSSPILHLFLNSLFGLFIYILIVRVFFNSDLQNIKSIIKKTIS